MAEVNSNKDKKIRKQIGLIFRNIEKTKYKIFSSDEVYSIYVEILKGNNTYGLLERKTGKLKPQLVELMQPLLKSKVVSKKPFTGTKGNPAIFQANLIELRNLFYSFFKECGFNEKEISIMEVSAIQEEFEKFIKDKKNILNSKNFSDLSEKFFEFSKIDLNKNTFSLN